MCILGSVFQQVYSRKCILGSVFQKVYSRKYILGSVLQEVYFSRYILGSVLQEVYSMMCIIGSIFQEVGSAKAEEMTVCNIKSGLNDFLDYISLVVCLVLPTILGPVLLLVLSPFFVFQVGFFLFCRQTPIKNSQFLKRNHEYLIHS